MFWEKIRIFYLRPNDKRVFPGLFRFKIKTLNQTKLLKLKKIISIKCVLSMKISTILTGYKNSPISVLFSTMSKTQHSLPIPFS